MLDAFYGAFAPACFALLGLWLVVVQLRLAGWRGSAFHLKRSYGVALHFVLPGVMSLAALIDPSNSAYWRVSFATIALSGAVVVAMVGWRPAELQRADQAAAAGTAGRLTVATGLLAIAVYVLIGALAFAGGDAMLRIEAFLLIGLVFLGFNGAWLLLLDETVSAQSRADSQGTEVARNQSPIGTVAQPGEHAPAGPQPEIQSPY